VIDVVAPNGLVPRGIAVSSSSRVEDRSCALSSIL